MTYLDADEVWTQEELREGYSAMAKDAAREREAEEWSEELIGDPSAEGERAATAIYFESVRSSENAPAPRSSSAAAMASASRWYSIPSPFCVPIQFMKKPFCR